VLVYRSGDEPKGVADVARNIGNGAPAGGAVSPFGRGVRVRGRRQPQAAVANARRQRQNATRPNPVISIAHVEGSGTPPTLPTPPISV
jgi:hypothetical protein